MANLNSSVIVEGLRFPEGPRWHDGRLFFSDMHDCQVMALSPDGAVSRVVEVQGQPSGLGWDPQGRLLVVSMIDRRLLRLEVDSNGVQELVEVASLGAWATWHCNDMVVDALGRAYVGNFGFDIDTHPVVPTSTCIVRVDPDGSVHVAASEMRFPNGSVITPDGATMIVGESFGGCLTAFDVARDGSLSGRRTWASLEGAVPDGICLDAVGAVWSACPISGRVLRVLEGGEVTDVVQVERSGAFACMLGGEDRRTLFVCTADSSNPSETGIRRGAIETCEVAVPGAGLP